MSEAFIGMRVRVSLLNGLKLEGLVSNIDQRTQYLTLTNVLSLSNGLQQELKTFGVAGADIQDLQILSSNALFHQTQPTPQLQPSLQSSPSPMQNPNKISADMFQNIHPLYPSSHPPSSVVQYSPQFLDGVLPTVPLLINATSRIPQPHKQTHGSRSQLSYNTTRTPQQQKQEAQMLINYQQDIIQPIKYPASAHISFQYPIRSRDNIPNLSTQPHPFREDPSIVSFSQPAMAIPPKPHHQVTYGLSRRSNSPPDVAGYSVSGSATSSFNLPTLPESSVDNAADICLDYEIVCSDPECSLADDLGNLNWDQTRTTQHVKKNRRQKPKRTKSRPFQLSNFQPHRYSHSSGKNSSAWAADNVDDYKKEEFDFQHNLGLFDKKKAFAEIKQLDSTDPEGLLVNINRNTGYKFTRPSFQNYGPLENVLGNSRTQKYYEDELDEEDNETANEMSDLDTWDQTKEPAVVIRTLTGITCPFVTRAQMNAIEKIAITETGPSEEQIIENAGRSTASMCLKALGGSRRIQPNNHNDAPLVAVLAGNTRTGIYGLSAARHLANHGCEVIVCVTGKEKEVLKGISVQSRYLKATGSIIIRSAAELPEPYITPVDLIVDALLGHQSSARDSDLDYDLAFIGDLIDWANDNKAPVLSLDMPSGFKGQYNSGNAIHPKWTLCLGAPRFGLKSRSMTGEIFLADIGIPHTLYKKAGVRGWRMPWGAEYLIGLEYS